MRLKRDIVAEEFEDNANELVSDMTESGIMIQTLRAFESIVISKGFVMKRELPSGIDKSETKCF